MAATADPPPYVVTVTAGEPETGLWCSRCLLPSLVRIPLLLVSETGVTRLGTAEGCTDCGEGVP